MKKLIFFIALVFLVGIVYQSCVMSAIDKSNEKNAKEQEELVEKVNKAISEQEFLTAYGAVDSYYALNKTYHKELATTLNKKIVMAEVGSILEQNFDSNIKATRIIMLIKERSMYSSEDKMIDDVIEIANVLDDKDLSAKLLNAKK